MHLRLLPSFLPSIILLLPSTDKDDTYKLNGVRRKTMESDTTTNSTIITITTSKLNQITQQSSYTPYIKLFLCFHQVPCKDVVSLSRRNSYVQRFLFACLLLCEIFENLLQLFFYLQQNHRRKK